MNTKILGAYAFFVSLVAAISLTIVVTLIGSAGTDKNAFERDIRNLDIRLAAAHGEAERLRQENERKDGEVEDLKTTLVAVNDRLATAHGEAERLRQENERKDAKVKDLERALGTVNDRLAVANGEAERLRQENKRKDAKIEDLERALGP